MASSKLDITSLEKLSLSNSSSLDSLNNQIYPGTEMTETVRDSSSESEPDRMMARLRKTFLALKRCPTQGNEDNVAKLVKSLTDMLMLLPTESINELIDNIQQKIGTDTVCINYIDKPEDVLSIITSLDLNCENLGKWKRMFLQCLMQLEDVFDAVTVD